MFTIKQNANKKETNCNSSFTYFFITVHASCLKDFRLCYWHLSAHSTTELLEVCIS